VPAGVPSAPALGIETGGTIHAVQKGETLATIAKKYNVSVKDLQVVRTRCRPCPD
jgi:LysM repeat protein